MWSIAISQLQPHIKHYYPVQRFCDSSHYFLLVYICSLFQLIQVALTKNINLKNKTVVLNLHYLYDMNSNTLSVFQCYHTHQPKLYTCLCIIGETRKVWVYITTQTIYIQSWSQAVASFNKHCVHNYHFPLTVPPGR